MIIDDRLTLYIHSLQPERMESLEKLRVYAEENGVPVLRRETESLLRVLLSFHDPEKILEIGTGVAYSALVMAGSSSADIFTIENYDKRIPIAKKNIADFGMSGRIHLLEGDSGVIVPGLCTGSCSDFHNAESFDMIFLDGAKGQYIELLPYLIKLLRPSGMLVADNVLLDGTIADSRFSLERRQRTIHERMRSFLWDIMHNDQMTSTVLTVGDGVSISLKSGK